MARIKELREKVDKGVATAEEVAELKELETEAADVKAEATQDDNTEAEIDKLADAFVEKAFAKMEERKEETKSAEEKTADVQVTSPHLIIDKKLGAVPVQRLDEIRIEVPGRKAAGKQNFEVSGKTIHFLHAMQTNDKQKLQILAESTNSGADGGYLVPEDFANMLIEDLRDAVVMRQLATVLNVTTDTTHVPQLGTRPQAQWRAEKAAKSTSTASFSEIVLTPYSLASIVPMTQELVSDATLGTNGSIVNLITQLMVQALAEKEDRAFWTGSGTGQPTGVSTYSVGSRTKSSNFADDLISLYYDLKQGYRNNAVWVGHNHVIRQLRQLKDSQNRYLVQDLGSTPFGSILGRPIYEQNDLSQSELYLGNFSYYYIADREGMRVDTSTEATVGGSNAFEKNLVFVRAEKRVDGELGLVEAVKKIINI